MKVIITGGGGFLGQCLAKEILARGSLRSGTMPQQPVTQLLLADVVEPRLFITAPHPAILQIRVGDIADPAFCESLVKLEESSDSDGLTVFHLGAVMSGTGEADFDLAMSVNLQGTWNVLEAVRKYSAAKTSKTNKPTFLFTSAGATIGSGHPADWVGKDDVISDATRAAPHTTYGCTKACCELLLADYSRRDFLDGRGVRLPTVLVRAGAPNAATTSCFSGVVREPLRGQDAIMPIGPHVLHAATGYRAAIAGILSVHDADPKKVDELLGFDRTVFLPSRAVSLSQLEVAMRRVVAPESLPNLGKIFYEEDEFLSSVVGGFPTRIDASRALELGAPPTPDLENLIREY